MLITRGRIWDLHYFFTLALEEQTQVSGLKQGHGKSGVWSEVSVRSQLLFFTRTDANVEIIHLFELDFSRKKSLNIK